jgi:hypothetical protein
MDCSTAKSSPFTGRGTTKWWRGVSGGASL